MGREARLLFINVRRCLRCCRWVKLSMFRRLRAAADTDPWQAALCLEPLRGPEASWTWHAPALIEACPGQRQLRMIWTRTVSQELVQSYVLDVATWQSVMSRIPCLTSLPPRHRWLVVAVVVVVGRRCSSVSQLRCTSVYGTDRYTSVKMPKRRKHKIIYLYA